MEIKQSEKKSRAIKFIAADKGAVVGRAYLYLIHNDLHQAPYGLLEDVFVEEKYRGQGIGTRLVKAVFVAARKKGCYKLIATSRRGRRGVHKLYEKLGLKKYGLEFRTDF